MITAADADASPEICARRGAFPSPDEVVNGVEADQSHDDQIDRHDEAQHYRGRSHLSKSGVVLSLALNSLPPLVPENPFASCTPEIILSISCPSWPSKLGIDVGQTTVAKYMAKHRRPPSQGWETFFHNHAAGI